MRARGAEDCRTPGLRSQPCLRWPRGAGCGVQIVGEGESGLQLEPGPTRRGPRGNFDELHFRNFSLLEERSTPRGLCTPLIVLLMNTDVSQGRVGAGCGGSIERRAICVIGKVRCRSLIVSFIRFVRFCWRRNSNTFHSFKEPKVQLQIFCRF